MEEIFKKLELQAAIVASCAVNSVMVEAKGVKLDLRLLACPVISPNEGIDEITLISRPDLAAMKLNAIANRGSKKDFRDLVELLGHFGSGR